LNHNEKILGVASLQTGTPEISLYDTELGFNKLTTFYGFKSKIVYLDFSTDNYYLQCEDQIGEVHLFEIETSRQISTDTLDFELEWLNEGLRSHQPLECIRRLYSKENQITNIVKVRGKPVIAVGDEIGTIRLFSYPNLGNEGYYQCKQEHLYKITKCLFSQDARFLVSVSSYDRCVFKWRCTMNDQKINQILAFKEKNAVTRAEEFVQ